MRNILKIKKSKVAIFFLICNQLIFSANALNFVNFDLTNSKRNSIQKK